MGCTLIDLNGVGAWAYVVELADGLRVRLALDDCQRVDLGPGQRVLVRLLGREVRLFVTEVTELPPVAWFTLAKRVHPDRGASSASMGVS